MNIAFVGNFHEKKGSLLFEQIVRHFGDRHVWYIFGYVGDLQTYRRLQPKLRLVRAYEDGQLTNLLKSHKIELAMTLSIWPETFSKTFFELAQSGVPCLSTDLGFPAFWRPKWPLFCGANDRGKSAIEKIEEFESKQLGIKHEIQRTSASMLKKILARQKIKYRLIDRWLRVR